ncbi:hypothetical protein LINPERPRIM_LOCUS11593 [Linum perenne]
MGKCNLPFLLILNIEQVVWRQKALAKGVSRKFFGFSLAERESNPKQLGAPAGGSIAGVVSIFALPKKLGSNGKSKQTMAILAAAARPSIDAFSKLPQGEKEASERGVPSVQKSGSDLVSSSTPVQVLSDKVELEDGKFTDAEDSDARATPIVTDVAKLEKDILAWKMHNAKVLPYIINSVEPAIALTLRSFPSAASVWLHLRKTYNQVYTARLFNLEFALSNLSQGDLDVNKYYLAAKHLWTELDLLTSTTMSS